MTFFDDAWSVIKAIVLLAVVLCLIGWATTHAIPPTSDWVDYREDCVTGELQGELCYSTP